jgi:superfamily I DNA/RNA helicase
MTDLLASLNLEQCEAVRHDGGPLLVVAGPGTGKTRTLTTRVAYLIRERGAEPAQVLAVTFSNRAADELRERLEALLGATTAGAVAVGTFHAIGWQILRRELGRDWSLCTEDAQVAIVRGLLDDGRRDAAKFAASISRLKGCLIDVESSEQSADAADLGVTPSLVRAYQAALDASGRLDFDDLIVRTIRLFEQSDETLERYRRRFRHIAVDEYQDTNAAQARLLELLVNGTESNSVSTRPCGSGPASLTVIGDPDQAIYAFRGASNEHFLNFERHFPGARVVRLARSYRSSPAILTAATAVIRQNSSRWDSPLESQAAPGPNITVRRAESELDEAKFVVREIQRLMGGLDRLDLEHRDGGCDEPEEHFSFADFAVLYRLHAIGEPLAKAFEESAIPFQQIGGPLLREQDDVRELLAVLRELAGPAESRTRVRLASAGAAGLEGASIARLQQQCDAATPAVAALKIIRDETWAKPESPAARACDRLLAHAQLTGPNLEEFLRQLDLETVADSHDPRAAKVSLMTLHAAKGLEFGTVFLVGCEASLLPYRPASRQREIEDERRLFYVGMTRARRRLHLSWAASRVLFGQRHAGTPSPFLAEIPASLTQHASATPALATRRRRRGPKQRKLFPA